MRRFTRVVVAGAILAAALAPAAVGAVANGGGRGTVDGVSPFSQFGFGVIGEGADTRGHFNCLMAGSAQFPGFTMMAVRGQVRAATIAGAAATFSGMGTLLYNFLGAGETQKADVTFNVTVTEGGAGVGTLQLTVIGVPFVPGGVAAFPPEHVLSGQITIH